jgi:hypothetical protein
MSLQTLTAMRKTGRAPAAIWVVVGNCPDSLKNLPDTIAVSRAPAAMDWRPVVGLHVDVFDLSEDAVLLDQTIEAIERAHPLAVGVACTAGVVGLSDEHEFSLRAIRRHLAHHS